MGLVNRFPPRSLRVAERLRDPLSLVAPFALGIGFLLPLFALLRVETGSVHRFASVFELNSIHDSGIGVEWTADMATADGVREAALGGLETSLATLALFTLLIVCVGVFCVALQRSLARRRELTIHRALGASRRQLRKRLLIEWAAIVAGGFAAGVALGSGAILLLRSAWPSPLPSPGLGVGWLSLVPALALALTLLYSWLGPTKKLPTFPSASSATKRTADGSGAGLLIACQAGGLAALLIGAGVLAMSVVPRVGTRTNAFEVRDTLVLQTTLADEGSATHGSYETLLAKLGTVPENEGVGAISAGGLVGLGTLDRVVAECNCPRGGMIVPYLRVPAVVQAASPGLFDVLRVPVLRGREFTPEDASEKPRVALINRAFARQFGATNPVGRTLSVGRGSPVDTAHEIVGVVDDLLPPGIGTAAEPLPAVYLPILQYPPESAAVVVRHSEAEQPDARLAEAVAGRLGARWKLRRATTWAALLEEHFAPLRWFALLVAGIAGITLLFAIHSVYATVSFVVRARYWELGTRKAAGATRKAILLLVLREVLVLAAPGLIVGLLGAVAVVHSLERAVSVAPQHMPIVSAAVAALLALTVLVGTIVPARQAANLSPLALLRHEG